MSSSTCLGLSVNHLCHLSFLFTIIPGRIHVEVLPVAAHHGMPVTEPALHVFPWDVRQQETAIPKLTSKVTLQAEVEFFTDHAKAHACPNCDKMERQSKFIIE